MAKSMYFKSVIVAMTLSVFLLAAVSADDKPQPPQEKPPTDSVLVETYLVEVSNSALAASGTAVLPGDGKKESVSITKLLWCMKDPNGGRVISTARVLCRANEEVKSRTDETTYIKQIAPEPSSQSAQYVSFNSNTDTKI